MINIIRCRLFSLHAGLSLGWNISNICHEEIILYYLFPGCSSWSDKSLKHKKRSSPAGTTYFKSSFEMEDCEEQLVSVWIDLDHHGELHVKYKSKVSLKIPELESHMDNISQFCNLPL